MVQICWLGVCLTILMIQAVTEAEQEVYRGGGPVRDSIGPKDGSENSSNATGPELHQKSIKSRVAPHGAMFPYWLWKKTRQSSQRCWVKIISTDRKTGFLIGHWKLWGQADITWPFQVNFSWFRGRKGSPISNNSVQSIKQLQLVLFSNFFSSFMLAGVLNRYYHLNQAKIPYVEKYQMNLGSLSD